MIKFFRKGMDNVVKIYRRFQSDPDRKREEIILRKINISSPNLEFIGPSGKSDLTASEAAAILAGLEKKRFEMGWMFITHNYAKYNFISLMVLNEATKIVVKEKWRLPKRKYLLRRMSALAVIEALAPRLCRNCRGHGQVLDTKHKLIVECKKCHGTGGGNAFSNTKRAKLLDVDKDNFNKVWAKRYNQIYMIPYQWLMDAFAHINEKY